MQKGPGNLFSQIFPQLNNRSSLTWNQTKDEGARTLSSPATPTALLLLLPLLAGGSVAREHHLLLASLRSTFYNFCLFVLPRP